ncbi:MAG: hypothetical protein Q9200_007301 [Gallowayella weberi]
MYITALPLFLLVVAPWTCSALGTATRRGGSLRCWDDLTKFHPIVFRKCNDVIKNKITKDVDSSLPFKFSGDPSQHPDIQLPKYWTSDDSSCGVGIHIPPDIKGYDRSTLGDIQAAARTLAIECVIKPPHLGGHMQVGWYDKMTVLMTGKAIPSNSLNATLSNMVEKSRGLSHG